MCCYFREGACRCILRFHPELHHLFFTFRSRFDVCELQHLPYWGHVDECLRCCGGIHCVISFQDVSGSVCLWYAESLGALYYGFALTVEHFAFRGRLGWLKVTRLWWPVFLYLSALWGCFDIWVNYISILALRCSYSTQWSASLCEYLHFSRHENNGAVLLVWA